MGFKQEVFAMSAPARKLHRWTRSEYECMVDAGVFHPQARLELVDGEIIEMSPQGSAHVTAIHLALEVLRRIFSTGYTLRGQAPLALDEHSEPEPDIAVVEGAIRDFVNARPHTVVLVVEVADSTLQYDRTTKARLYARNSIPEYWIVNLQERRLEVYSHPVSDEYKERRVLATNQLFAFMARPENRISVAELFP
jgi:Uma2 family endonuclease